jgi:predicted LPLAT superfamily acyltransferase
VTVCAVVPSHDHYRALGAVVARLRSAGLAVFIVDDGSAEPGRSAIAALHDEAGGIVARRLEVNRGKGAAVIEGFRLAAAAGFSHAVQVDADGQHDLDALPRMLALSARYPHAAICGHPVYDASIPKARAFGHRFTNAWIRIETLSFRISDGMCGFRVYPLAAVEAVLSKEPVGQRMDFDTDIVVRLFWRGTPVKMVPVKVIYPPGNTSNFDVLRDNWRITRMHTRLVCTMLLRLPSILRHRPAALEEEDAPRSGVPRHWASLRERGAYWGLRFCALAYRLLGRRGCRAVLAPIALYFYLVVAGSEQRQASLAFLTRALGRPATFREGYRHVLSFARRALDTFIAWTGGVPADAVEVTDRTVLDAAIDDARGAVIVVAHIGNLDLARAVLDEATRARLTLLVHTRHAVNYNRVLREFRPEAAMNAIQVTEIGPATAIDLKTRVERGEWVVIAGDRTPVLSQGRVSIAPFMGHDAAFSHGPWVLGAVLDCPVHLMFCLRDGERYKLTMERFAERITLPRGERSAALGGYAARYAARLEHYARLDPFQWYNFFDFWAH